MIAVVLYELSLLGLVFLSWSRETFFYAERFESFSTLTLTLLYISFLLLFGFYLLLYNQSARTLSFSGRKFYIWVMPLVLILAVTPPVLSMDAASYLIYAKNFFIHGQNPFLVSLSTVTANPWVAEFSPHWWTHFTSPYGPVFTLLLAPIIYVSGGNLFVAVIEYKILLVGVYVLCIFLCERIVKFHKLDPSTTLLFALNPAILIHGILEGHNDFLLLASIFLGIYYFSKSWGKSICWVSFAFCIKFIPGVFFPALFAHDRKIFWKKIFSSLGIVLGILVLAFLPFHFPLQAFWGNLVHQSQLGCFYGCSPIVRLTKSIWPTHPDWFLPIISAVLFLVIWYWFAWRKLKILEYLFWTLCILFFVLIRAFAPWYSLTLIGIGVLLSSRLQYRLVTMAILFYSFMNYFGA